MMYTSEKNAQILIALLKEHGIKRIVANPGTANMSFVGSVQSDPWFEIYSGVDERHSAYVAVGMAAETLDPVVLSCTGATASRNYLPALTEAFYRKLPVLAITSTQEFVWREQLHDQVIDRSSPPKDVANLSIICPLVKDDETFAFCEREVNRAILELQRHGGGPVHINLETRYPLEFNEPGLPVVRKISRTNHLSNKWPSLPSGKIALWIGAHKRMTQSETSLIEEFVHNHNAVVLTNTQSAYAGFGSVSSELLAGCGACTKDNVRPDLIIHLGETTAAHFTTGYLNKLAPVWRVSEDGEIRDLLGTCTDVFEMSDYEFFGHYAVSNKQPNLLFDAWRQVDSECRSVLPELPFSNYWVAQSSYDKVPRGSVLHLGILSSVRSWNFCPVLDGVAAFCNSGGFGIDGNVSTLIGSSLVSPDKLHFGVVGDLSFFYDLNAIGNRHIGKNLRLIVIDNGEGLEFSLFCNPGSRFGEMTKKYIGAGGHFGHQSRDLIRHYATDLGFEYLCATSKEEFESNAKHFFCDASNRPIIFECFVSPDDDKEAFRRMLTFLQPEPTQPSVLRAFASKHIPTHLKQIIKSVVK